MKGKGKYRHFLSALFGLLGVLRLATLTNIFFYIFFITPEGRVLQGPLRLVQLCFLGRRIYKTFTGTKLSYWGPHP